MSSRIKHYASFVFLLFLGGCAANPSILSVNHTDTEASHYEISCISKKMKTEDIASALRAHTIDINKDGQFSPIKFSINCPPDPLLKGEQENKIEKVVETIVSNLKNQNFKELFIYIHGGLVTREAGIESAVELTQAVLGESNSIYPVSIVWRSGGWESYRDQLFNVRNGKVDKALAIATSPFKLSSDLGRGFIDTPYAGGLEANRLFLSLSNRLNYCVDTNDSNKENVICPEPSDFSALDKAGDLLGTTSYLLLTPVRIATAPLINGLGRSGWENMIRRTREAFLRDTNISSENGYKGAAYQFFEQLQKQITAQEINITITLIGHSMGTMLANEIIRQFPDLRYKHVVFMGAAISIKEFQNVMVPHLSKEETFKFYNLSLLPVAETREMNDFLGAIPTGSLLEWIDDMFESPPTLADRTLGKWTNIRDLMPSLPNEAKRNMTMRIFGERKGQPQEHGQFNDIKRCFWRESFWTAKDGVEWDEHLKKCSDYLENKFQ